VARQGSVVALEKTYTSSDDMPPVTPQECREALNDIERFLLPYDPKSTTKFGTPACDSAGRDLYLSLSPEQVEQWKAGPLPVRSLAPNQKVHLRRFLLHFFAREPLTAAGFSRGLLGYSLDAQVGYQKRDSYINFGLWAQVRQGPTVMFGFVMDDGVNRIPSLPPLDGAGLTATGDGTSTEPDCLYTLERLFAALPVEAGKQFRVAPELAQKPITCVGVLKSLKPPQVLEVAERVAELYGLRLRKEPDGYTLMRRTPRPPADVGDIPAAAYAVLPRSLVRTVQQEKPLKWPPWTPEEEKTLSPREQDARLSRPLPPPRVKELQTAAMTKVRAEVDRLLAERYRSGKKPDDPDLLVVPVTELSRPVREAVTYLAMHRFLDAARTMWKDGSYVTRMDEFNLIGGPKIDKETGKVVVMVATKTPDGKLYGPGALGIEVE
jgi:hypothetical protein